MAHSLKDMPVKASEGKRSWKPVVCIHDQGSKIKEGPQTGFFHIDRKKKRERRKDRPCKEMLRNSI